MITFLCFSKDRPLQLQAYLQSLHTMLQGKLAAYVLYTSSSQPYGIAYQQIAEQFPSVTFLPEIDFAKQVTDVIQEAEYICFGCDDVVFTDEIQTYECEDLLTDPDIVGLSLRLGINTTHNMFWGAMQQPSMTLCGSRQQFVKWQVRESTWDWGYAWEVLGTIYPGHFAQKVVHAIHGTSPSQLELQGSLCWQAHTAANFMAAYQVSKLVVPTVNVIQQEFPNGICGNIPLDPEFLLDCWNHQLRLDTARYAGVMTESWRIGNFFLTRI